MGQGNWRELRLVELYFILILGQPWPGPAWPATDLLSFGSRQLGLADASPFNNLLLWSSPSVFPRRQIPSDPLMTDRAREVDKMMNFHARAPGFTSCHSNLCLSWAQFDSDFVNVWSRINWERMKMMRLKWKEETAQHNSKPYDGPVQWVETSNSVSRQFNFDSDGLLSVSLLLSHSSSSQFFWYREWVAEH